MQVSRLKSLNLALIFCLLPLGLKAQTTTDVSTAVTTAHTFAASGDILAITATGSIIVSSGVAVTGHADGDNTITNAGEISSTDSVAIVLQSLNTVTNSGTITGGTNRSGIHLEGTALAATVTAQATRPAYDASDTLRDAYYFNNKVVNNTGGTITGNGTGHGILIEGARAQILNTGGTITSSGLGSGIYFNTGSGQGFVQNSGNITGTGNNAIRTASGVNAITIHNTGTISSTSHNAIYLQSLNLIVNSGGITSGGNGIYLDGGADATMLANNPTRPAYNASDAIRDAYYFNNKVINEVVGTNTGTITGTSTNHGIEIAGARVQILNTGGTITSTGTGTGGGHGVRFRSGSGQGFVQNSGNITGTGGNAINAESGVHAITIHNTGTIESTSNHAIVLQSLNLIVNSNAITGGTNSDGISLEGAADTTMLAAQATRPAHDAVDATRDAYYFNNKVINNTGGIITGKDLEGSGIFIDGTRVQILNTGGTITAEGDGNGVYFFDNAGQGFVYNTGSITASTSGFAIVAEIGVDAITIHNTGTIESASDNAIFLRSLNLVVNSGAITGGTDGNGILLSGAADATEVTNNPTAPAYDTTDAAVRDDYYFNNKVINEVVGSGASATTGTITGKGAWHGIGINGARAQILNMGGDIVAEGTGHGILFNTGSGQGFVQNTGNITSVSGSGISAATGINEIIIHNTGTIESTSGNAIVLQSLNLIVNSNAITGGTNSDGIQLSGTADATEVTNNPTRPAYDSTQDLRDAYYFNNKIINEVVGSNTGTITGKGTDGHGINIAGARVQILNNGGTIEAVSIAAEGTNPEIAGTGHGIYFDTDSGQGFIQNTGMISAVDGNAIAAAAAAASPAVAAAADAITIHNTGTIESTGSTAIVLQSRNLIVNSGAITGGISSIWLQGAADATEVTNNPTAPAYNAPEADRDAYYFNNKVINEAGGTITTTVAGHGVVTEGTRTQILNSGNITVEIGNHGIRFYTGSGQGFVYNAGSISGRNGNAINASVNEIIIHNTGTMESATGFGILLQNLNLVVNSGDITGSNGVYLAGLADADMVTANPDRPAYDTADTALRDAYYFNNKVINEADGVITGRSTTGSGVFVVGARAQILNHGEIVAEGTRYGITFTISSGQSFVQNSGSITSASGSAISAITGNDEIVIHNTGTLSSTSGTAIVLQSLNLIVNSGEITAGTDSDGIQLAGTPLQATLDANPTAPAWDASETDRDAYYFNNTIINEVGGTITGKGTGHGISVTDKRAQIFNHGDIIAEGTGHGIYFGAASGESIVVNTGNIRSEDGWGIYADDATDGSIVVINGGCIEGGLGAIRLSGANDILVIRTGSKITGNVDFDDGDADELIYAGVESSDRPAADTLLNLETTSESDSDSDLGIDPPDSTPDPNDGSGDGSGGGSSAGSSSMDNYATLFRLSDEIALDLNASIKDALYEHNFGPHSEKNASEAPSLWARGFGSFRKQDETNDNAEADHTLGGILIGYDFVYNQERSFGFFLGAALGTLDTDNDAELTTQDFFGGFNLKFNGDSLFYGFNFVAGFTPHESERSVEESGETVKIKGDYKGYFFSPEFVFGLKTQMEGVNIIPSFRVRYLFASLGSYDEDGSAENRISVKRRDTITMESRAQLAFPLQLSNQQWSFEPRLGLQYRADLNKDSFDAETIETKTPINYDAEKENTLGIFGGLSIHYLTGNTAFKFNVDTIYNDESLVLRAQAGFGLQF